MPPYAEPQKVEASASHEDAKRKYIRIENTEYDVTDFKHPGGNIINYMLTSLGADATETFKEFI